MHNNKEMAKIKEIPGRLILKHDIEANWNRAAGTFIPKQGEIIIYDIDDSHPYERFKIGDGEKYVDDLPFYLENELLDVLNRINYIANNTLDAKYEDGMLLISKGITIPV